MNINKLIKALQADLVAVYVKFEGTNRRYAYKAHPDMGVKEGDKVIVDTPSSGLKIVDVLEVKKEMPQISTLKWVVQKVNTADYEARVSAEESVREKLQAMAEAKEQELLLEQAKQELGIESDVIESMKQALVNPSTN